VFVFEKQISGWKELFAMIAYRKKFDKYQIVLLEIVEMLQKKTSSGCSSG
jgi:hypothetical protein